MGKQSRLERIAIQNRKESLVKNDYRQEVEARYSATHPDAISDGDALGKGIGSSITYSVPNEEASTTMMVYNVDTITEAGGKYDIEARKRASVINIYNPDNAYGKDSVDSSINIAEGQYFVR